MTWKIGEIIAYGTITLGITAALTFGYQELKKMPIGVPAAEVLAPRFPDINISDTVSDVPPDQQDLERQFYNMMDYNPRENFKIE